MKQILILKKLYPGLFFIVAIVLFFPEAFWGGKVLIPKMGDAHLAGYSFAAFFKNMAQQGSFPLWNPLVFCGTPFGADAFYNLNLLHLVSFWTQDLNLAWNLMTLMRTFLTGLCAYLYMRQLGLHPIAGLFTGVIIAFSPDGGAYVNSIDSWIFCLPLVLWLIEKFYAKKKARYLVFVFFSFVVLFLNAMPQHSLYTGIFFAAYILFRFKSFLGIWILTFAAGAVSFHLIRLFELLALSPRGHLWIIDVVLPTHLINFIFPHLFEAPHQEVVSFFFSKLFHEIIRVLFHSNQVRYIPVPYFGVLGLTCALLVRKGRGPVRFYVVAVASILFYLMTFPIFAPVYKHIPILAQLFRLERINPVFTFAFAVLAGIGFDRLILQKVCLKQITAFYAALLIFILGVLSLTRYLTLFHGQRVRTFLVEYINHHVHGSSQYQAPLDFYLRRVDEFFLFIGQLTDVSNFSIILPVVFILLTLAFLHLWQRRKMHRSFFLSCCFGLIFIDLFAFAKLSFLNASTPQELVSDSGLIRYLEADAKKEIFRVVPILEDINYGGARARDILAPNLGMIYGLSSVEGYNPMSPKAYSIFVKNFQHEYIDYEKDPGIILFGPEGGFDYALTDFLNVKYFITTKEQKIKRAMPIVYKDTKNVLYLNPTYYPRAFLVQDYVVSQDPNEILSILKKQKTNLRHFAVLGEKPTASLSTSNQPAIVDEVIIEKYMPELVQMKISAMRDSILVMSDNYFPGWKATIDGYPAKVLKANFSFRAVSIPKGVHVLDFVYQPESFRLGLWFSVFFVLSGLAVLIKANDVC